MKHSTTITRWAQKLTVSGMAVLLAIGLGAFSPKPVHAQQGVAPTAVPAGGCAIDGNLLSRVPVTAPFSPDNGDFLPNESAPGTGGFVFTSDGLPVDTAMAFHVVDGYNNGDGDIFTGGSKVNQDPNLWMWMAGKPPAKDDINHAMFFFSSDTSGNIWFAGSGDRKSTNGNTYLDFELLQNPLYKNPDSTFTSTGPDGGRTLGDLIISVTYTNGGTNPQLFIYQWSSTDTNTFGYLQLTPPEGTVFLATNKDSSIVVPYGAFGAGTYPASAFTEVACNLNGLISGTVTCLNVKTVIVKTKASQALNAALKDFAGPVQVSVGSTLEISVNDAEICSGDSAVLTVTVSSGSGPFTYLWNTGDTTQSITVSPDTTTEYSVTVTGGNGCSSATATATVTVSAGPSCFITGADTLCPSGTGQYSGPDSLSTYAWTVTGNGTIQGSSSEQTVMVQGNGGCDSTFTLTLVVTGTGGCSSSCTKNVTLLDTESPVLADVPGPLTVLCASQVPPDSTASVTATDNCEGTVSITVSDEVTDKTCANHFLLIRTWTAMDLCGNTATASQTITVNDTLAPVLEGVPADTGVCCADSIPLPPVVTAFDSCDGQMAVTMTEVISDSTGPNMFILTRTWTATDSCSNLVTASQVIQVNDTLFPARILGVSDGQIVINLSISPNPLFTSSTIKLSISEDAEAVVELYNAMGVRVRSLYTGRLLAGIAYNLRLTPDDTMDAGMYLLVVRTNRGVKSEHLVITK